MGQLRSRRDFLASASAATLALAGVMPTRARAQSAVTLRVSSSLTADQNSAHYIWYQRFAANVKSALGPRVTLGFFPNSQLGKEADVVQQVKVGSIDMMITGSSIWATVAPEFGMLDLGYMFDSNAHAAKALDGGVGAQLARILNDRTGCTVLGWASHFGPRSVYYQDPGQLAGGDQRRQAPGPADACFHRDIQADGGDPDADPVQRALHGGADRSGGWLRARRGYRACLQAVRGVEALLAHRAPVQPDDRGDRQARAGQDAGRHPACSSPGGSRGHAVRARASGREGQGRGGGVEAPRHHFSPDGQTRKGCCPHTMQTQLWSAFAVQYPATKTALRCHLGRAARVYASRGR